jgi:hypothetical protein
MPLRLKKSPYLFPYKVTCVLQGQCTENWKPIFPEMKLRGLVPNSYIRVSVIRERLIYIIPTIGPPILLTNLADLSWEYSISTAHRYMNADIGNVALAVSFLGIHKSDLVCGVEQQTNHTSPQTHDDPGTKYSKAK